MCGRFSNGKDPAELGARFPLVNRVPCFAPRYNIAPRQEVPVLVREAAQRVLKTMRWGLVPSWSAEERSGDRMINARAETLAVKPAFRRLVERQRCLIPADGFYEWQTTPAGKMPFRFTLADDSMFCFAGLWDRWERRAREGELELDLGDVPPPGSVLETFTIITTEANAMVRPVHDRMPVILDPGHYDWWLRPDYDADFVGLLLRPLAPEKMQCYRVSTLVNQAKVDHPDCARPA